MEQTLIHTHADGRQECHPLFNQTIFEALLCFFTMEDLKLVRLVCRRWRHFARSALQERAWVNMGMYNRHSFLTFLEFVEEGRRRPPNGTCDVTTGTLQYQNFKFSSSCWLWNVDNLDRFIRLFGSTLKSLNFVHVVLCTNNFRTILGSCPNLEELTFVSSYFYQRDAEGRQVELAALVDVVDAGRLQLQVELKPRGPNNGSGKLKKFTYINTDEDSEFTHGNLLPFTWDELFSCFPSLTELNLIDLSEEKRLIFMTSLRQHRSRLEIKKLNIFGQSNFSTQVIEDHEWTELHRLCLQLDSLQIDVGQIVNEKHLKRLLSQQAPTLRSLRIWRGILAPDADGFPYQVRLGQLEHLELPCNLVKSLGFLNCFPKLRTLWLRLCDTDPFQDFTTIFDGAANANVGSHEELRALRVDALLTTADRSIIERVLPKLTSLKYFE